MVSFTTSIVSPPSISLNQVRLSNGVTLNYAHQGPPTGPAVLLLHGYSDSWFSFSRILPLMSAQLRIIAPDLRGHGDSDRPQAGYRMSDLADDVVRLMDAIEIPKAVVVGHSMGSFVARKVLEQAPGRLSRLVLAGGGPTADTPVMRELRQAAYALTDPVDDAFVRDFQMSCIAAPVPDAFIEAAVAISRHMPARVWRANIDGLIEYESNLQRPPIRTLVLGGRQDAVFPVAEHIALARQFPRGELQLEDGVGHTLHWEKPSTFVNALVRFGV